MKLLNLAILKLLLSLVTGILLGYYFPAVVPAKTLLPALITTGALLGLAFYYNTYRMFEVLCFVFFAQIGYTNLQHREAQFHKALETENTFHHLVFQVITPLKKGRSHYRYRVRAKPPGATRFSEQLIIRLDTTHALSSGLVPGAVYRAAGTPQSRTGLPYPGAFDYHEYLHRQNTCFVLDADAETLTQLAPSNGYRHTVYRISEMLSSRIENSGLRPFTRGILQALVLGNRELLDSGFQDDLRTAGGAHLAALSGLHIGIFTTMLALVLWPLRRIPSGRWMHFSILATALTGYVLITGASPSVVRAAIMYAFIAYSILISRRASSINTLILSAFVLLLFHPWFLFDVGFQLSYAAVTGILITNSTIRKLWRPAYPWVRWLWNLTAISAGAQLFTAPMVLHYFGQLPATFLITNLLLTPLISLFLAVGYLTLTLLLITDLPKWMINAIDGSAYFIKWLTHTISFPEWVISGLPPADPPMVIALYLLILTLGLSFYTPKHLITLFTLILVFQVAYPFYSRKEPRLYICHRFGESALLSTGLRSGNLLYHTGNEHPGDDEYPQGIDAINHDRKLPLPHFLRFGNDYLLILDRTPLQQLPELPEGLNVLLINSSPVNLDRLIDSLQPKLIIADGSNYPSAVSRWKSTCRQKNIPFHHTGEKGYYMLSGIKRD